jgi:hypothetical protein
VTLDTSALSPQVTAMGQALQITSETVAHKVDMALGFLHAQSEAYQELNSTIQSRKPPWSIAGLVEPLDTVYPQPPPINEYIVAATDGSQIDPDRHGAALCHLVNIGWAYIRYGSEATAKLSSRPELAYEDHDVYLVSDGRRTLISGQVLDIKRNVLEMERLAELAEAAGRDIPMLAIADGVLVLRAMEGWRLEQQFRRHFLPRFQKSLRRFQALGTPVAAYISRPRSYELASALRVAACPYTSGACSERCSEVPGEEPCSVLAGVPDRLLMEHMPLARGQRSARFRAASSRDGTPSFFFYVHSGIEIARVEVPDWVASQRDLMDLTHSVVLDQCQRGNGYPRALTEAHESAVLTTGDRQRFQRMIDAMLSRRQLSERTSAKERTKRVRGI